MSVPARLHELALSLPAVAVGGKRPFATKFGSGILSISA
jgi:hypothetical protein